LADLLVPGTPLGGDVDAGELPEPELGDMRAGSVAARNEGKALVLQRVERSDDVARSFDSGRIASGPTRTKPLYITG
jgi:hypothetical protein